MQVNNNSNNQPNFGMAMASAGKVGKGKNAKRLITVLYGNTHLSEQVPRSWLTIFMPWSFTSSLKPQSIKADHAIIALKSMIGRGIDKISAKRIRIGYNVKMKNTNTFSSEKTRINIYSKDLITGNNTTAGKNLAIPMKATTGDNRSAEFISIWKKAQTGDNHAKRIWINDDAITRNNTATDGTILATSNVKTGDNIASKDINIGSHSLTGNNKSGEDIILYDGTKTGTNSARDMYIHGNVDTKKNTVQRYGQIFSFEKTEDMIENMFSKTKRAKARQITNKYFQTIRERQKFWEP